MALSGCGEEERFAVPEGDRMVIGFADSSAAYPYPGSPDPERFAELEAAAGGEIARLTIRWEEVQPESSSAYDWSQFEPALDALADAGIAPLPILLGAPGWARDPGCGGSGAICPPALSHHDDFAGFAAAFAEEFGEDGLAAIEVWNEPNLAAFWQTSAGPDPERYADLFAGARAAIRDVDPELTVLIGGLANPAGSGLPSGRDISLATFLERFYTAVPAAALDPAVALSIHPYPAVPAKPEDLLGTTLAAAERVIAERDPGRRLWATEVGLSTTDPRGPRPPDEREQAGAVMSALGRLEQVDAVQVALVYTLVDRAPDPAEPGQEGYGVIRRGPGFDPKLAYCEIAAARGMPAPEGC